MTLPDPVVIVGAMRTPIGGLQGALASLAAPQLGALAIRAALAQAGLKAGQVEEVLMGCVLPAGLGQAPARQAARLAGLGDAAGATTVNKMCGSGMKAVMLAQDLLLAGPNRVMVAGGMESMSNAPYLLAKARGGYRLGHARLYDHMFLDGLEDVDEPGRLMGSFAEDAAEFYGFSRAMQDDYALASLTRALRAGAEGRFAGEIVPVMTTTGAGEAVVAADEQPGKARPEKIPALPPAFRAGGTVTAANSSSISDGAAALVLMRRSEAEARGLTSLAIVMGHASFAQAPPLFTSAPVGAIEALLRRLGWRGRDVDLWEINEAFAVVVLIALRALGLDPAKVNIHGGACALGHPIGASGARIVVTLLAGMRQYGLRRGIAALCIGGGEATALALELP